MARFAAGVIAGMIITTLAGAAVQLHASDDGTSDQVEPPAEDAPVVEPPPGLWDRLAACESSGQWHLEGTRYSGGLQFDSPTWIAYGGLRYAPRAALASRAEQIAVAEVLRSVRGFLPWPVCSKVVGLR